MLTHLPLSEGRHLLLYNTCVYLPQLGLQFSGFVYEIFPNWIAPLRQNKASNQSQCEDPNNHSQPHKEQSADVTLLCRIHETHTGHGSGAVSDVPYPENLVSDYRHQQEPGSLTQTPTPWNQYMYMVGPNFKNTQHSRLSLLGHLRMQHGCLFSPLSQEGGAG